jgi:hypothetical protein
MKSTAQWRIVRYAALVAVGLSLAAIPAAVAQDIPPPPGDAAVAGEEPLTRGPIHEAFASPTTLDPVAPLVVPQAPPADIDEVPPQYQPEGEDIIWIPGYWAWDDERSDFFWISGVWRERPPGERWVPGYWNQVEEGYQWVPGFWIDENTTQLTYLPAPPDSLEQGPSSPQPGDDYFWIPGNFVYINASYQWSPGYWAPYQQNWIWTPACYYYTPQGYIYSAGFHDFRFSRRGQMFAPVYFQSAIYRQPGFVYTPRIAINAGNLFVNLWIRPNYCHYYFGNYYGQQYSSWNLTPWYQFGISRRHYDPLWAYSRVHYGLQGINYANRMQGWHNYYVQHQNARPARTYAEQLLWERRNEAGPRLSQNIIGADLRQLADNRGEHAIHFHKLDDRDRRAYTAYSHELKDLHRERIQTERDRGAVVRGGDNPGKPASDTKAGDSVRNRRPTVGMKLPKLNLPEPVAAHRQPTAETLEAYRKDVPPRPDSREVRARAEKAIERMRGGTAGANSPTNPTRENPGIGNSRKPGVNGTFNDESGPTLDQRIREAREHAAGQAGQRAGADNADNASGKPRNPPVNGTFNDESGPTLDQRLREARERAAGQAGQRADKADNADKAGGRPRNPPVNGTFNDESGPTLDQRLREARERAAGQAGQRGGAGGTPKSPTPGAGANRSRVPRIDIQELPGNAPKLPAANPPGRNNAPRVDPRNFPRADSRTEARRVELPQFSTPRNAPEVKMPQSNTPRIEIPRTTPKAAAPARTPKTPKPTPSNKGGGNRKEKKPR